MKTDELDFLHAGIAVIGNQMDELRKDRDEWKSQHENLLAVREQDISALNAHIAALEAELAAAKAEKETYMNIAFRLQDEINALKFALDGNKG